jgi:hypothetical protein
VRDPRLAEIDFLMELERDEQMTLIASEQDEHGASLNESTARWYGLGFTRFRAMVVDLVLRDFLVGERGYQEAEPPHAQHLRACPH